MFLNYLTLLVALAISAVAIYYSVSGLAAIFAASVIPIIIMGSILEISKLTTAVWLHKHWKRCVWWLKTYLSLAVVVLMFITSLGIFGFLSKSHIEQAAASDEQQSKIEFINEKIIRSGAKVKRWEEEILRLSNGSTDNIRVDNLINRETDALDKVNNQIAAERSQLLDSIDSENSNLIKLRKQLDREKKGIRSQMQVELSTMEDKFSTVISLHQETMSTLNTELKNTFFGTQEVQRKIDIAKEEFSDRESIYNDATIQLTTRYDVKFAEVDASYNDQIQSIRLRMVALQQSHDNIREKYSDQILVINSRIDELKVKSNDKTSSMEDRISQLEDDISGEQEELNNHRIEKTVLESQFRLLEAEVGPIKYLADFIYNDAVDKSTLEKAVRLVILTIIFVFDPLAVLLLIASQYSFEYARSSKDDEPSELIMEDEPVDKPEPIMEDEPVDKPEPIMEDEPVDDEPSEPIVEDEPVDDEPSEPIMEDEPVDDEPSEPIVEDEPVDELKNNLTIDEYLNYNVSNITTTYGVIDANTIPTNNTEPTTPAQQIEQDTTCEEASPIEEDMSVPVEDELEIIDEPTIEDEPEIIDEPTIEDVTELDDEPKHTDQPTFEVTFNSPRYVNYKNHSFQMEAFNSLHPEFRFDVSKIIPFGKELPKNSQYGDLFLWSNKLPASLYRYNGDIWEMLDRRFLMESSYNMLYIKELKDVIARHPIHLDLNIPLTEVEYSLIEKVDI